MIKQPTVLILGAGASADFGYPVGSALYEKIHRRITFPEIQSLIPDCSQRRFADFIHAVRGAHLGAIDAFLVRNPLFMDIGKAAIALTLMPCEAKHAEFKDDSDTWIHIVFRQMAPKTINEFAENKITIVTFNYDRAVEYALHSAIAATYPTGRADASRVIEKVPIIHVHGRLGDLPWEGGLAYGAEPSTIDYQKAAKALRIVDEAREDTDEFIAAREAIDSAARIYFLGFAYNEDSLRRLGFPRSDKPFGAPFVKVFGCARGLSPAQAERAWFLIRPTVISPEIMVDAAAGDFLNRVEALDES